MDEISVGVSQWRVAEPHPLSGSAIRGGSAPATHPDELMCWLEPQSPGAQRRARRSLDDRTCRSAAAVARSTFTSGSSIKYLRWPARAKAPAEHNSIDLASETANCGATIAARESPELVSAGTAGLLFAYTERERSGASAVHGRNHEAMGSISGGRSTRDEGRDESTWAAPVLGQTSSHELSMLDRKRSFRAISLIFVSLRPIPPAVHLVGMGPGCQAGAQAVLARKPTDQNGAAFAGLAVSGLAAARCLAAVTPQ